MEPLKALFGEWLPDLPDLDNPGLIEATGVIAAEGGYRPFRGFVGVTTALGATSAAVPLGGIIPFGEPETSAATSTASVYVGTPTAIYFRNNNSASWTQRATVATTSSWSFQQFENLIIAGGPGNPVQCATVGSGSSFANLATSGTAPPAVVVGVIGKFVVISLASDQTSLQWSAIEEPRNWPTPGTSTATATQAGTQAMPYELGNITGIFGTDQYGIILQQGGVSRMQYIGGTVVFQFDVIDHDNGSRFLNSAVMVGGVVYYASEKGFFATDGVRVTPIGDAKVSKFFMRNYGEFGGNILCGYDRIHDVIYWAYPDGDNSGGFPIYANKLLMFHRASGRWTYGAEEVRMLVTPASGRKIGLENTVFGAEPTLIADLWGFNRQLQFARFMATAGAATIITTENELLPGRYSHVSGVKPLIEYSATAPAVQVSIGSRNDQGDSSLAFSGTTTATTDTGFHDFRDSARYHRVKIQITGEFEKATGVEYQVIPEGQR